MDDWYKRYFEIPDSVSQTIEHFNKSESLYRNSIYAQVKDILEQEELKIKSMASVYSSFPDMMSSIKQEIERARGLHFLTPIIDSINQANSSLASLFPAQSELTKLIDEISPINHYWEREIKSISHFAPGINSAEIVLQSHFDNMARTSLLAQELLLKAPWEKLERSTFNELHDLSGVLDSFNTLTQSYDSLIQSFKNEKLNVVAFPPFVSGLPPIEVLTSSDLIFSISRDETEDGVEEDERKVEIREDIENSFEELLSDMNPKIIRPWQGAKKAIASKNPDKTRHVVVSLREMLTHILHSIAPDSEVSKWTSNPDYFSKGRPTRKARLLYACRDINHGPFEQFVSKDIDSHIMFLDLFQRGTHDLDTNFTDQQLKALIIKAEALGRLLLITSKNNK